MYANYVRHRQSIHTQEVKNAPESTTHSPDHASAPDTCQLNPQSILSIIVDDAETQALASLSSGSKDKPASCNVNQCITQPHALSKTCQSGYYRLQGRQRQHHRIMRASWQTQTPLVWIQLKFLFSPSVRLVIVRRIHFWLVST